MSEPTNGTNGTVTGAVRHLASQTIRALAPQFLALIVLNMLFFGVFLWFTNARATHTVDIINQLMQSCLQEVNHANQK